MAIALLVWMALLYLCSGRPGWFGCLFILLVAGIALKGCAG
jgi:hypothetical protein